MSHSQKKYEIISKTLRQEILSGHYGNSGRLPSESILVKRFEASRPTIAKALQLLVTEGLVERIAGSGTYVKGKETDNRQLRGDWLAFLAPDLGNTEIFQIIGGEIASFARMRDLSVVWGPSRGMQANTPARPEDLETVCRQFIERKVSGVFFAPYELVDGAEDVNSVIANTLRDAGIPVILLDRDLTKFPQRSDFDLVSIDNFVGGFRLAEHLIRLGCQTIHFVARQGSAPSIGARIAGAREAMARHKLEILPNWIQIGKLDDPKFLRRLTGPIQPDAYICANDHTAAILLNQLNAKKKRVPHEVRIVGFDNVKFSTLVMPTLTTMQQPCRAIAQTAFRAMMDRIDDPTLPARNHLIVPRLIIRDSCGAYTSGRIK